MCRLDIAERQISRLLLLCAVALIAIATGSCGASEEEPPPGQLAPLYETRHQAVNPADISGFCQIQTDRGDVPIVDYLASVVSCEAAASADMEALKAQAIAARSFALDVNHGDNRPLRSSQADQHYDCGRPLRPDAREAVEQTAGMVLQYNDTLVRGYYVAGSTSQSANCRGLGSDGVESRITYNEGKSGAAVEGFNFTADDNRGVMSQNGAVCLETQKEKTACDILKFYYGEDIEVVQLQDTCVPDTIDPEAACGGTQCTASSEEPEIIPRSQWGARPPAGYGPKHNPSRISIHHAVTPNDDPMSGADRVRWIQDLHMVSLHQWPDIGYHFVIDHDGKIYRGAAEDRIGTHVGGQNSNNLGINLLGQFHPPETSIAAGDPTEAQLKSAGRLVSYLADKYGFEANRQNVIGHRENPGQTTACPGNTLLDKIDDILKFADAGALCHRPERPYDEVRETPDFDLDDATHRYLKIRATGAEPEPYPAEVGGFEVDSVFFQSEDGGSPTYAARVASADDAVDNPQGAVGSVNNDDCDARASNAAVVPTGSEIVLEFDSAFTSGDLISVIQSEFGGLQGCDSGGTAQMWASPDAQNWVRLGGELVGNTTGIGVPSSSVKFASPRAEQTYSTGQLDFRVDASPDIQSVTYYVGSTEVGTGTDWDDGFRLPHQFDNQQTVRLTAKGLDADGRAIAQDTIEIRLDNDFRFARPNPSRAVGDAPAAHHPEVTLQITGGGAEITSVSYEADGTNIGESTNAATGFRTGYTFANPGRRHLIAYGYNDSGEVVATAEMDVDISDQLRAGLEFVHPVHGGWYTPNDMTLRARRLDPNVVSVDYLANGDQICRSGNPNTDFACTHSFEPDHYGRLELTVVGYDTRDTEGMDLDELEEHKIAETTIEFLLTDEDGTVPGNKVDRDRDLPVSGGSFSGCGGDTPQGTREELADQLLQRVNAGQIDTIALTSTVPRQCLDLTAGGEKALCTASHHPPCQANGGRVYLQESMLAVLVKLAEDGGRFGITSLSGGTHSATSKHYYGQAFDIGTIEGAGVTPSNNGLDILNACQSCGGNPLGPSTTPFAYAGHETHLHCSVPPSN